MAFSSKEYEWQDLSVVILGRTITGIQSIEYTKSQEKEYIYGRGNNPLAIQSGNRSYEGTMELLRSEYNAILAAAKVANPLYDELDISFDLVVCYNKQGDSKVTTDTLLGVEFTEASFGMSQDDMMEVVSLPIKFLRIVQKP